MNRTDEQRIEKIINARHRYMRQEVKRRAAELKAKVEDELNSAYHFDDEDVWREAMAEAKEVERSAQERVKERCRELGIPAQFAPSVNVRWSYGGGEGLVDKEKSNIRNQAHRRIDALKESALMVAEEQKLTTQMKLLAGNLEGDEAVAFMEGLPDVKQLMPIIRVNATKLLETRPDRQRYDVELPEDLLEEDYQE